MAATKEDIIDYLYSRKFVPYYVKDDNDEIVIMTKADEQLKLIWMNCWLSMGYGRDIKDDSEERKRAFLANPPPFVPASLDSISKEEAAEINSKFILRKCLFRMALDAETLSLF